MRGLYAIIDPQVCRRDALEIAQQVLAGGCAALQLRDKLVDDPSFVALGHALVRLCRAAGVPFFVNDRHWLVEALDASGVHIGQSDAKLTQVRAALGPGRRIGVSTHSAAQAAQAERDGADLIGFGPVFATHTKVPAEPSVGLSALADVCARATIPVVAIGGITRDNARAVAGSGASMCAAISALCASADPETAARELHASFRQRQCGVTT